MLKEREEIFTHYLGQPTSRKALADYIEFVLSKFISENLPNTQLHHLLPQSIFKEHIHDERNHFRLFSHDHITAHILLAKAYPIRAFMRPLNYMLKHYQTIDYDHSKASSDMIKKWWAIFKTTAKYQKWRQRRSEYMSEKMRNGHASYLSQKRFTNPHEREKVGNQFKELWQSPEYRERVSNSMKVEKSTNEAKKRMRNSAIVSWSSPERKAKATAIMTVVNKDPTKRSNAGKKLKALWQTPEFRKKAMKRRITYWWNNGEVEKKASECPANYVRGRLKGQPKFKKDRIQ